MLNGSDEYSFSFASIFQVCARKDIFTLRCPFRELFQKQGAAETQWSSSIEEETGQRMFLLGWALDNGECSRQDCRVMDYLHPLK